MSTATEIAGFIAKFDPTVARRIRAARAALRNRLPAAVEMIYDNYNFLVFGFGPSERASEAILSLAAASNGVALCFIQGAKLPDPTKILLGAGRQTRSVRLPSAATLEEPAIEALIGAAIAHSSVPMPKTRGYTVIKSVSAKQRPRRAAAKSESRPAKRADAVPRQRPAHQQKSRARDRQK